MGEKILVPLVAHTVKSQLHPSVRILLEGNEADAIKFDLEY